MRFKTGFINKKSLHRAVYKPFKTYSYYKIIVVLSDTFLNWGISDSQRNPWNLNFINNEEDNRRFYYLEKCSILLIFPFFWSKKCTTNLWKEFTNENDQFLETKPLWIGHATLSTEVYLKLRLQSL